MSSRAGFFVVCLVLIGCGRADADRAERLKIQRDGALNTANLIRTKTTVYRAENGNKCPTADQLWKDGTDPWGHAFKVTCVPGQNVAENTVVSFGPDGVEKTADDIVSLSR